MNQDPFYRSHDWHQAGLSEYTLLVNPDETVAEKVMIEKEYFQDRYGAEIATRTKPYITIAHLLLKEQMEDLLCRYIQNVCNLQYSFEVVLNNFSGFPHHTVFIRVQDPKPFSHLTDDLKKLDSLLQPNGCPPLQLIDKPHMGIVRQLDKNTYERAIAEYAQRSFFERFTLNKLVLFKRENRYKKWQTVTNFYLPAERNLFN